MNDRLDLSRLEAYVDGQLDAAAMSETAEQLLTDPEFLGRVRALHRDAALLRAAYQEAAEAPVPPALLATIDRGFARHRRARRDLRGYAMAAALALGLLGGLTGYLLGEYRAYSTLEATAAGKAGDQRILAATIEQALERTVSGHSVAWRNSDSGAHGQVMPVRTYRSKSNHWCREYLASNVTGGDEKKIRAIACRVGDGDWVKVEQFYHNS